MHRFTNYQKAVFHLIHAIPKTDRKVFDDSATIEKNFKIMRSLGDPQNRHSAVHVAGTSGKGTICYLVDAILRAHTKRTGMIQSPHVYDIRERIQTNGQLISERLFVRALNQVLQKTSEANLEVSYFETLTAMGFYTIGNSPVDYQIIETGLGGRLDCTNVIDKAKKLCILGQIGFDHTEALGETLEKIAAEKAGIIQPGNHVVALRQDDRVNGVFEKRCQQQGATLVWIEQAEDYQKTNDRLAITACQILAELGGWQLENNLVESVLQQIFIPGRFEKRRFKDHLCVLDGAHNAQKLTAVAKRLQYEDKAPVSIVLALGDRKDMQDCLHALKPVAARIIATEYFTKQQDIPRRPTPADDITNMCRELGIEARSEPSPDKALAAAALQKEPILITGSFYLLGEVDKLF